MEEYDDKAQNADCLRDSVMAIIDYLAVLELHNGNRVNASGVGVLQQTHDLMKLLDEEKEAAALPETFTILRTYPNPFNSMTNIRFNLKEESRIKLTIHDLQGREVAALYKDVKTAGVHNVLWDASGQASGVYFCRLEAGGRTKSIKLAMMK